MRKNIAIIGATLALAFLISGSVLAQSLNKTPSSDVLVSAFGSDGRTGTTLTNFITTYGTRELRAIIDGGKWDVTNNVTWPTNMTVSVTPGSWFEITNSVVMDFQSNSLEAADWALFAGSGSATGAASFLYRWPIWGDEGDFHIGDGRLGTNVWNISTNIDVVTVEADDGYFANIWVSQAVDVKFVSSDRLYNSSTSVNFNGYQMVPQETITIGFSNDMSTAEIQEEIDAVRKYVPYPNNVFFQFSNGVYTLTSRLYFQGFYGGGHIYVQGDTTESGLISSTRRVVLDFSSGDRPGLSIRDNECQIIVRDLKILCKTDSAPETGDYYSPISYARTSYGRVEYCALWGTATNSGDGLNVSRGTQVASTSNVVVSLKFGYRVQECSELYDDGSSSLVTNPTHGLIVQASDYYRRSTILTGQVSNLVTNWGGRATGGP